MSGNAWTVGRLLDTHYPSEYRSNMFGDLATIDSRHITRKTNHWRKFQSYQNGYSPAGFIYFFLDCESIVTYIGMTTNIATRFKKHNKLDADDFSVCFWRMLDSSVADIRSIEMNLIHIALPKKNVLGCSRLSRLIKG